jgi:DNA invertase Pin-like site-specific DNA recombinase
MPLGKRQLGNASTAIGYVRVSTEEQNLGPEAQRDEIRAWAKRQGVEVVAWHEDRLSGATPAEKREGLLSALADLKELGAGLLVAAKRDRLARDVVVAATIERLVEDAGARVVTADGVSAEATAEGQLMRTLLDAFAQYERARIRARIRAAMAVKRKRGEFLGEAALGQVRHQDGLHVVPHPLEQAALARIRELRQGGLTVRAIAAKLNAEGVPARGARWYFQTVHRVLRRGA